MVGSHCPVHFDLIRSRTRFALWCMLFLSLSLSTLVAHAPLLLRRYPALPARDAAQAGHRTASCANGTAGLTTFLRPHRSPRSSDDHERLYFPTADIIYSPSERRNITRKTLCSNDGWCPHAARGGDCQFTKRRPLGSRPPHELRVPQRAGLLPPVSVRSPRAPSRGFVTVYIFDCDVPLPCRSATSWMHGGHRRGRRGRVAVQFVLRPLRTAEVHGVPLSTSWPTIRNPERLRYKPFAERYGDLGGAVENARRRGSPPALGVGRWNGGVAGFRQCGTRETRGGGGGAAALPAAGRRRRAPAAFRLHLMLPLFDVGVGVGPPCVLFLSVFVGWRITCRVEDAVRTVLRQVWHTAHRGHALRAAFFTEVSYKCNSLCIYIYILRLLTSVSQPGYLFVVVVVLFYYVLFFYPRSASVINPPYFTFEKKRNKEKMLVRIFVCLFCLSQIDGRRLLRNMGRRITTAYPMLLYGSTSKKHSCRQLLSRCGTGDGRFPLSRALDLIRSHTVRSHGVCCFLSLSLFLSLHLSCPCTAATSPSISSTARPDAAQAGQDCELCQRNRRTHHPFLRPHRSPRSSDDHERVLYFPTADIIYSPSERRNITRKTLCSNYGWCPHAARGLSVLPLPPQETSAMGHALHMNYVYRNEGTASSVRTIASCPFPAVFDVLRTAATVEADAVVWPSTCSAGPWCPLSTSWPMIPQPRETTVGCLAERYGGKYRTTTHTMPEQLQEISAEPLRTPADAVGMAVWRVPPVAHRSPRSCAQGRIFHRTVMNHNRYIFSSPIRGYLFVVVVVLFYYVLFFYPRSASIINPPYFTFGKKENKERNASMLLRNMGRRITTAYPMLLYGFYIEEAFMSSALSVIRLDNTLLFTGALRHRGWSVPTVPCTRSDTLSHTVRSHGVCCFLSLSLQLSCPCTAATPSISSTARPATPHRRDRTASCANGTAGLTTPFLRPHRSPRSSDDHKRVLYFPTADIIYSPSERRNITRKTLCSNDRCLHEARGDCQFYHFCPKRRPLWRDYFHHVRKIPAYPFPAVHGVPLSTSWPTIPQPRETTGAAFAERYGGKYRTTTHTMPEQLQEISAEPLRTPADAVGMAVWRVPPVWHTAHRGHALRAAFFTEVSYKSVMNHNRYIFSSPHQRLLVCCCCCVILLCFVFLPPFSALTQHGKTDHHCVPHVVVRLYIEEALMSSALSVIRLDNTLLLYRARCGTGDGRFPLSRALDLIRSRTRFAPMVYVVFSLSFSPTYTARPATPHRRDRTASCANGTAGLTTPFLRPHRSPRSSDDHERVLYFPTADIIYSPSERRNITRKTLCSNYGWCPHAARGDCQFYHFRPKRRPLWVTPLHMNYVYRNEGDCFHKCPYDRLVPLPCGFVTVYIFDCDVPLAVPLSDVLRTAATVEADAVVWPSTCSASMVSLCPPRGLRSRNPERLQGCLAERYGGKYRTTTHTMPEQLQEISAEPLRTPADVAAPSTGEAAFFTEVSYKCNSLSVYIHLYTSPAHLDVTAVMNHNRYIFSSPSSEATCLLLLLCYFIMFCFSTPVQRPLLIHHILLSEKRNKEKMLALTQHGKTDHHCVPHVVVRLYIEEALMSSALSVIRLDNTLLLYRSAAAPGMVGSHCPLPMHRRYAHCPPRDAAQAGQDCELCQRNRRTHHPFLRPHRSPRSSLTTMRVLYFPTADIIYSPSERRNITRKTLCSNYGWCPHAARGTVSSTTSPKRRPLWVTPLHMNYVYRNERDCFHQCPYDRLVPLPCGFVTVYIFDCDVPLAVPLSDVLRTAATVEADAVVWPSTCSASAAHGGLSVCHDYDSHGYCCRGPWCPFVHLVAYDPATPKDYKWAASRSATENARRRGSPQHWGVGRWNGGVAGFRQCGTREEEAYACSVSPSSDVAALVRQFLLAIDQIVIYVDVGVGVGPPCVLFLSVFVGWRITCRVEDAVRTVLRQVWHTAHRGHALRAAFFTEVSYKCNSLCIYIYILRLLTSVSQPGYLFVVVVVLFYYVLFFYPRSASVINPPYFTFGKENKEKNASTYFCLFVLFTDHHCVPHVVVRLYIEEALMSSALSVIRLDNTLLLYRRCGTGDGRFPLSRALDLIRSHTVRSHGLPMHRCYFSVDIQHCPPRDAAQAGQDCELCQRNRRTHHPLSPTPQVTATSSTRPQSGGISPARRCAATTGGARMRRGDCQFYHFRPKRRPLWVTPLHMNYVYRNEGDCFHKCPYDRLVPLPCGFVTVYIFDCDVPLAVPLSDVLRTAATVEADAVVWPSTCSASAAHGGLSVCHDYDSHGYCCRGPWCPFVHLVAYDPATPKDYKWAKPLAERYGGKYRTTTHTMPEQLQEISAEPLRTPADVAAPSTGEGYLFVVVVVLFYYVLFFYPRSASVINPPYFTFGKKKTKKKMLVRIFVCLFCLSQIDGRRLLRNMGRRITTAYPMLLYVSTLKKHSCRQLLSVIRLDNTLLLYRALRHRGWSVPTLPMHRCYFSVDIQHCPPRDAAQAGQDCELCQRNRRTHHPLSPTPQVTAVFSDDHERVLYFPTADIIYSPSERRNITRKTLCSNYGWCPHAARGLSRRPLWVTPLHMNYVYRNEGDCFHKCPYDRLVPLPCGFVTVYIFDCDVPLAVPLSDVLRTAATVEADAVHGVPLSTSWPTIPQPRKTTSGPSLAERYGGKYRTTTHTMPEQLQISAEPLRTPADCGTREEEAYACSVSPSSDVAALVRQFLLAIDQIVIYVDVGVGVGPPCVLFLSVFVGWRITCRVEDAVRTVLRQVWHTAHRGHALRAAFFTEVSYKCNSLSVYIHLYTSPAHLGVTAVMNHNRYIFSSPHQRLLVSSVINPPYFTFGKKKTKKKMLVRIFVCLFCLSQIDGRRLLRNMGRRITTAYPMLLYVSTLKKHSCRQLLSVIRLDNTLLLYRARCGTGDGRFPLSRALDRIRSRTRFAPMVYVVFSLSLSQLTLPARDAAQAGQDCELCQRNRRTHHPLSPTPQVTAVFSDDHERCCTSRPQTSSTRPQSGGISPARRCAATTGGARMRRGDCQFYHFRPKRRPLWVTPLHMNYVYRNEGDCFHKCPYDRLVPLPCGFVTVYIFDCDVPLAVPLSDVLRTAATVEADAVVWPSTCSASAAHGGLSVCHDYDSHGYCCRGPWCPFVHLVAYDPATPKDYKWAKPAERYGGKYRTTTHTMPEQLQEISAEPLRTPADCGTREEEAYACSVSPSSDVAALVRQFLLAIDQIVIYVDVGVGVGPPCVLFLSVFVGWRITCRVEDAVRTVLRQVWHTAHRGHALRAAFFTEVSYKSMMNHNRYIFSSPHQRLLVCCCCCVILLCFVFLPPFSVLRIFVCLFCLSQIDGRRLLRNMGRRITTAYPMLLYVSTLKKHSCRQLLSVIRLDNTLLLYRRAAAPGMVGSHCPVHSIGYALAHGSLPWCMLFSLSLSFSLSNLVAHAPLLLLRRYPALPARDAAQAGQDCELCQRNRRTHHPLSPTPQVTAVFSDDHERVLYFPTADIIYSPSERRNITRKTLCSNYGWCPHAARGDCQFYHFRPKRRPLWVTPLHMNYVYRNEGDCFHKCPYDRLVPLPCGFVTVYIFDCDVPLAVPLSDVLRTAATVEADAVVWPSTCSASAAHGGLSVCHDYDSHGYCCRGPWCPFVHLVAYDPATPKDYKWAKPLAERYGGKYRTTTHTMPEQLQEISAEPLRTPADVAAPSTGEEEEAYACSVSPSSDVAALVRQFLLAIDQIVIYVDVGVGVGPPCVLFLSVFVGWRITCRVEDAVRTVLRQVWHTAHRGHALRAAFFTEVSYKCNSLSVYIHLYTSPAHLDVTAMMNHNRYIFSSPHQRLLRPLLIHHILLSEKENKEKMLVRIFVCLFCLSQIDGRRLLRNMGRRITTAYPMLLYVSTLKKHSCRQLLSVIRLDNTLLLYRARCGTGDGRFPLSRALDRIRSRTRFAPMVYLPMHRCYFSVDIQHCPPRDAAQAGQDCELCQRNRRTHHPLSPTPQVTAVFSGDHERVLYFPTADIIYSPSERRNITRKTLCRNDGCPHEARGAKKRCQFYRFPPKRRPLRETPLHMNYVYRNEEDYKNTYPNDLGVPLPCGFVTVYVFDCDVPLAVPLSDVLRTAATVEADAVVWPSTCSASAAHGGLSVCHDYDSHGYCCRGPWCPFVHLVAYDPATPKNYTWAKPLAERYGGKYRTTTHTMPEQLQEISAEPLRTPADVAAPSTGEAAFFTEVSYKCNSLSVYIHIYTSPAHLDVTAMMNHNRYIFSSPHQRLLVCCCCCVILLCFVFLPPFSIDGRRLLRNMGRRITTAYPMLLYGSTLKKHSCRQLLSVIRLDNTLLLYRARCGTGDGRFPLSRALDRIRSRTRFAPMVYLPMHRCYFSVDIQHCPPRDAAQAGQDCELCQRNRRTHHPLSPTPQVTTVFSGNHKRVLYFPTADIIYSPPERRNITRKTQCSNDSWCPHAAWGDCLFYHFPPKRRPLRETPLHMNYVYRNEEDYKNTYPNDLGVPLPCGFVTVYVFDCDVPLAVPLSDVLRTAATVEADAVVWPSTCSASAAHGGLSVCHDYDSHGYCCRGPWCPFVHLVAYDPATPKDYKWAKPLAERYGGKYRTTTHTMPEQLQDLGGAVENARRRGSPQHWGVGRWNGGVAGFRQCGTLLTAVMRSGPHFSPKGYLFVVVVVLFYYVLFFYPRSASIINPPYFTFGKKKTKKKTLVCIVVFLFVLFCLSQIDGRRLLRYMWEAVSPLIVTMIVIRCYDVFVPCAFEVKNKGFAVVRMMRMKKRVSCFCLIFMCAGCSSPCSVFCFVVIIIINVYLLGGAVVVVEHSCHGMSFLLSVC
eukprot:gene10930-7586_t